MSVPASVSVRAGGRLRLIVRSVAGTATLQLAVSWAGAAEFSLAPRRLALAPRASRRVYVRYAGRWRGGAPAHCAALVAARGPPGAWCRAAVRVCAAPARDHKCRLPPHDHTDDRRLPPAPPFDAPRP